MIDWKGNVEKDDEKELSHQEIYNFFTKIFQSTKTLESPTITDVSNEIQRYEMYIPSTDMDIQTEEIDYACQDIGNGTGVDGLPPFIAKILPQSIRSIVKLLFQHGDYPSEWENSFYSRLRKKIIQYATKN